MNFFVKKWSRGFPVGGMSILDANFFVKDKFGRSGSKLPAGDFWFFSSEEKNIDVII